MTDPAILALEQRVTWLERQHRLLLEVLYSNELNGGPPVPICRDSRCTAGKVPHVVEPPNLCPILERP